MTDAEKAEYDEIVRALTSKLEQLAAENARLRSAGGAHDVLRRIYLDEAQPSGTRVKAAQASINFEKSKLESVPPPLELTAEPAPLPLAEIVRLQRARLDKLAREAPRNIRVLSDGRVIDADESNAGNGSDTAG
jgi:hypothetical protein